MITRESIIEAYLFLREKNQNISDETLDFMKRVSLEALINTKNSSISDVGNEDMTFSAKDMQNFAGKLLLLIKTGNNIKPIDEELKIFCEIDR